MGASASTLSHPHRYRKVIRPKKFFLIFISKLEKVKWREIKLLPKKSFRESLGLPAMGFYA